MEPSARHGRRALRAGIAVGIVVGACAVPAASAFAGASDPPNCLGTSFRALAAHSAGGFGQGVVSFAQAPGKPGLGDGIAAVRAGVVPDGVVENTCN